jgi:hypothetical protein
MYGRGGGGRGYGGGGRTAGGPARGEGGDGGGGRGGRGGKRNVWVRPGAAPAATTTTTAPAAAAATAPAPRREWVRPELAAAEAAAAAAAVAAAAAAAAAPTSSGLNADAAAFKLASPSFKSPPAFTSPSFYHKSVVRTLPAKSSNALKPSATEASHCCPPSHPTRCHIWNPQPMLPPNVAGQVTECT